MILHFHHKIYKFYLLVNLILFVFSLILAVDFSASINVYILETFMETDPIETLGMLSSYSLYLLLFLIIAIIIYKIDIKANYRFKKISYFFFTSSVILLLTIFSLNRLGALFPFNYFFSFNQYFAKKNRIEKIFKEIQNPQKNEFSNNDKSPEIIILLVDEAVNKRHMSIYNYQRNTTPKLKGRLDAGELLLLNDFISGSTTTIYAIGLMMSNFSTLQYKNIFSEKSFIHILNEYNYKTILISNNDPGVYSKILENDVDEYIHVNPALANNVYDIKLLDELLKVLNEKQKDEKLFVMIHMAGSHWKYIYKYPTEFESFLPVNTQFDKFNTNIQRTINSYDNRILYSDYLVDSTLSIIEDYNSMLFYLADHGESLGRDGLFLHGSVHEDQVEIPGFIFYSTSVKKDFEERIECIEYNQNKQISSSDLVYHFFGSIGLYNGEKAMSNCKFKNDDRFVFCNIVNGGEIINWEKYKLEKNNK